MAPFIEILSKSPLFSDLNTEEISIALTFLTPSLKSFIKDQCILQQGSINHELGIIINGSIQISIDDYFGNRSIIANILSGEIFNETFACLPNTPCGVNVVACKNTEILFFDVYKIMSSSAKTNNYQTTLMNNLLLIFANKNLMFMQKMEHLSKRSTFEKILSYLSSVALSKHSNTFEIPFNRQQLADFLLVERSALSFALSKLKKNGVLEYHKNRFHLLKNHLDV